MNEKAVVLLSGGLDSATTLAIACSEGYEAYTMTFHYGQRHNVELRAAKQVAQQFDVMKHVVMDIDMRAIGGSALTDDLDVPKNSSIEQMEQAGIPITYVPARNTIFLSFALGWAEVLEAGHIFIGVNAIDYSGYPDCRPEFIRAYETMANLATRAGVEGNQIQIHTPLIDLTKAEIIQRGTALGIDYSMTHSCYDPADDGAACGRCDSCVLRNKGFIDAGIQDPTRYVE